MNKTMLNVSTSAASKISELLTEEGKVGSGLRVFVQANVEGVYLHDLPRNTAWRQRFLERVGFHGRCEDWDARLDREIDRVATAIEGWTIT